MTTVTVLRDDDRTRLARAVATTWDAHGCTWVVPADAGRRRLGDLLAVAEPTAASLDDLVTAGSTTLELPVPDDAATIVTSSGTTGPPKVVCLSRRALDASARGAHARLGLGPGDRWLLALPLHHVAGQSVVWRAGVLGHHPVVQERLDVDAANAAGVTIVSLVPTQLHRVVADDRHLDGHVLLGGAAISPRLLARARSHVGGVTRTYGLTETGGGCVYDGVPFPEVEVTARDGLLAVRGPVLASGLVGPDGLVPIGDDDGWLWTSDLGTVAADGTVTVTGRADDVIVTGGAKVNPAGVEVALEDHPAIARAGVVGLPDPEWGEVVAAALVLANPAGGDGRRTPDPWLRDDLDALARAAAGPSAVPRRWLVVDEVPLTGLGKVARDRLRAAWPA